MLVNIPADEAVCEVTMLVVADLGTNTGALTLSAETDDAIPEFDRCAGDNMRGLLVALVESQSKEKIHRT